MEKYHLAGRQEGDSDMKMKGIGLIAVLAAVVLIAAAVTLYFVLTPSCITLTVEATEAAKTPGETVTLDVVMSENPGFTEMSAYVDYDRERLEFVRVEDTYTVEGTKVAYLPGSQVETGVVEIEGQDNGFIKISSLEPISEKEKTVFAVTFRIRPEAEIGVANVSVFGEQFSSIKNEKEKIIDSVSVNGGVLVGKSTCLHVDQEKDTICDLCGVQIAAIEMFDIERTEVRIDDAIRLEFCFTAELMKNKEYIAFITHNKQDGELVSKVFLHRWESTGVNAYKVGYVLKTIELSDVISIAIRDNEGYSYNNAYQISVRELVMDALDDEQLDASAARMYVDLLNYGAAAQQNSGYNMAKLANNQLTEVQQALATKEVSCADISVRGTNFVGASLAMDRLLALNVYFEGFKGKNVLKMYAEIKYTDYMGNEQTYEIPGTEFLSHGEEQGKAYRVVVDRLAYADAEAPVTVTIYNEDGSVHGSCVDSVESYIARKLAVEEAPVHVALLKLAASCKAYYSQQ